MFRTDKVMQILIGKLEVVPIEQLRNLHHKIIDAYLDNEDVYEITLREMGSSFMPVTYRKIPVGDELRDMVKSVLVRFPIAEIPISGIGDPIGGIGE